MQDRFAASRLLAVDYSPQHQGGARADSRYSGADLLSLGSKLTLAVELGSAYDYQPDGRREWRDRDGSQNPIRACRIGVHNLQIEVRELLVDRNAAQLLNCLICLLLVVTEEEIGALDRLKELL